ncbi:hypothetical protein [Sphaerisporangium album]|uniref:hypothetical protein n=1 Tax=Sphaerisporangium album TaxID=509200 RepID=UPI0011C019F5|nr:hypothetical protein [Sphaerisporangium album]
MRHVRVLITEPAPEGRARVVVADEHVCVTSAERDRLAVADVIVGLDPGAETVQDMLRRHPGCLVAVRPRPDGRCVVGTRDGQVAVFATPEPWAVAAAAHAWTVAGRRLDTLGTATLTPGEDRRPRARPGGAGRPLVEVRRVR